MLPGHPLTAPPEHTNQQLLPRGSVAIRAHTTLSPKKGDIHGVVRCPSRNPSGAPSGKVYWGLLGGAQPPGGRAGLRCRRQRIQLDLGGEAHTYPRASSRCSVELGPLSFVSFFPFRKAALGPPRSQRRGTLVETDAGTKTLKAHVGVQAETGGLTQPGLLFDAPLDVLWHSFRQGCLRRAETDRLTALRSPPVAAMSNRVRQVGSDNTAANFYFGLPLVTRTIPTLWLATTTLAQFGLLSPAWLYLSWGLVFRNLQVSPFQHICPQIYSTSGASKQKQDGKNTAERAMRDRCGDC